MPRSAKRSLALAGAALLFLLTLALALAAWWAYPIVAVGAAYKAKVVCSAVFLSRRPPADVLAEDVHAENLQPLDLFNTTIDHKNKTVTASLLGLASRTAAFRKGVGATLAIGVPPQTLLAELPPVPPAAQPPPHQPWPLGSRVDSAAFPPGVDRAKLNQIVDAAFAEPDPGKLRRTRAIIVVHDGRIIAEKYAPGFSHETPLPGWSMTKSVTHALIGILVRDGKISLQADALLPQWRTPGDPRRGITLDHLLRMSSGLEFVENYEKPREDVTTMLFRSGNASSFAAAKPLLHPPGKKWHYNSGTTNIICRVLRETIDNDADYHAFPYRELFHPIGMTSAVLERDAAGTFIGSSFMFATARDWARFGLLYANDGVWNGSRLLPEGWVEYAHTPTPAALKKSYGAHFWLRAIQQPSDLNRPNVLPPGAFHMSGHEGQFVSILPKQKLVVVRLGLTLHRGAWNQESFVAQILTALPH